MKNDKLFLLRAVEIAREGIETGGGPFGALIVKDEEVVAESNNRVVLNNDPTAHAEILAIRLAASVLKRHDLSACTLYSTCEPCPMCLGAIYWSGIKKVIYACDRIDAEQSGFSDNLIYREISLDPSERRIEFIHLYDEKAKDLFRKWDELENKIPY